MGKAQYSPKASSDLIGMKTINNWILSVNADLYFYTINIIAPDFLITYEFLCDL